MSNQNVVFYDGDCGVCNRSVNFVMKNDKTQQIHFAAIQSDYVQGVFKELNLDQPDLSTFYFYENGKMYSKSTGAMRLTKYLKFPARFLAIGWIFPRFLRDAIYDFVAKRRKKIAKGYCVIPTEQERKRFLG